MALPSRLTCVYRFSFFSRATKNGRWLRFALYGLFVCGVVSVMLTYSRGGLVGLGVVLTAITIRSRHKLLGGALLVAQPSS